MSFRSAANHCTACVTVERPNRKIPAVIHNAADLPTPLTRRRRPQGGVRIARAL